MAEMIKVVTLSICRKNILLGNSLHIGEACFIHELKCDISNGQPETSFKYFSPVICEYNEDENMQYFHIFELNFLSDWIFKVATGNLKKKQRVLEQIQRLWFNTYYLIYNVKKNTIYSLD